MHHNKRIFELTASAVLLAAALIIRSFTFIVPISGAPIMRISFSGPFIRFVAIAFGPLYGGVVYGLYDLIGFFIVKQDGTYIPWMTVILVLQGALVGILWRLVRNISSKSFAIFFTVVFSFIGLYGIINVISLNIYPDASYTSWLNGIGLKTSYSSIGYIVAALIGLVSVIISSRFSNNFLKLLFCTGIPALLHTTVNTWLLQLYLFLGDKPFILLWMPRMAESLIMVFYNAYLLVILMKAYELAGGKFSREKTKIGL